MNRKTLFLSVLLILTLAACSPAAPSPTAQPQIETAAATAQATTPATQPGAQPQASIGLQGLTPIPPREVVPTPSGSDKATVTGILKLNKGSPQPAANVILVLAEVHEAEGVPMVAGFDRTTSPSTITDAAGRFIFSDVLPGKYALVFDKVTDAVLLNHPDTGGDLIFDAQPSQVYDAGELIYAELPALGEAAP